MKDYDGVHIMDFYKSSCFSFEPWRRIMSMPWTEPLIDHRRIT